MKFLLDENADRRLVPFLKQLHHDVTVIGEDYPASLLDHEVLTIAVREQRIILTNDDGLAGERGHCGDPGESFIRGAQLAGDAHADVPVYHRGLSLGVE